MSLFWSLNVLQSKYHRLSLLFFALPLLQKYIIDLCLYCLPIPLVKKASFFLAAFNCLLHFSLLHIPIFSDLHSKVLMEFPNFTLCPRNTGCRKKELYMNKIFPVLTFLTSTTVIRHVRSHITLIMNSK